MPTPSQRLLNEAHARASKSGFGCFSGIINRKGIRYQQVSFIEVEDPNGPTFRFSTDENDNLFVDILTEGDWQRGGTYEYHEGQVVFLFEAQNLKITATREYVGEGANMLCRWSFSSQVIASEDISGINLES